MDAVQQARTWTTPTRTTGEESVPPPPRWTGAAASQHRDRSPARARPHQKVPASRRGGSPGRSRDEPPVRSGDFDHLSLSALRAYRLALAREEDRVSYWRRILQARLDVVRADVRPAEPALRRLLTDERVENGRRALVQVLPHADDLVPLPKLGQLWDRDPATGDPVELARDLVAAEAELSAYRAALHRRLAAATDELIARYREEPTLCLSALPLPRTAQSPTAARAS